MRQQSASRSLFCCIVGATSVDVGEPPTAILIFRVVLKPRWKPWTIARRGGEDLQLYSDFSVPNHIPTTSASLCAGAGKSRPDTCVIVQRLGANVWERQKKEADTGGGSLNHLACKSCCGAQEWRT